MTQSEFENWTQLQELEDAVVKPSKLSTTGAGPGTQLAVEHAFRCENRGYPRSETISFGDVTPAEIIKACLAPMGGLIALFPAPLQQAVGSTYVPELKQITITNPSGSHEAMLNLPLVPASGYLVAMGWVEPEMLLAISSTGTCSVVSPTGRVLHSFDLHERSMEVVHARIFHSGVVSVSYPEADAPPHVVLTTWDGCVRTGKVQLMRNSLPVAGRPGQLLECLALQHGPPVRSEVGHYSGQPQVILAPKSGGLWFCSTSECREAAFPWTASHIACSGVTGSAVAVITKPSRGQESWLHILDGNTQTHGHPEDAVIASVRLQSLVAISAFAFAPGGSDASCRALDVAWVGDCAVAVLVKQQYPGGHATRQVFVFSASGHAAEVLLDDDEPCQLAPELDGCVVLGEHTWTLVRDVPMAVQRALSPGTTEPAGLLLAASQYYSDKDARCESLLKALRSPAGDARPAAGTAATGTLPEAIQDCVMTAGWVHRVPLQRELLGAAIYGRSHAPDAADAALIPLCALHARLLNSLRKASKAGRGTTRKQLEWLILHNRLQYIADVLCSCELFPLAFDIASDPRLPVATGPVLLRWAQAVIDILGTDREACLACLRKQLDHTPGASWAAVAEYARERNFLTLVEDLLALDPRDRHVVPQLMQLHPFSGLALSKALRTCAAGLTLLVLLDSFRDGADDVQSRHFYEYLRDPDPAAPRGLLPDQAADVWQSFVLALVLPLPNVTLGSFKGAVFDQHYWNAPPIHRALLTLSEVVVSTGGPLKDGEEPGANKGRTRAPEEWDGQQRQLRKEARALQHPGAAAPRPGGLDGVRRGVSGLFGVGRNAAWWQAAALKEYADLRGMQQRLEGQAKLQLVGLSVMDTARKLKEKQQDALYQEFVEAMLPDRGKSGAAVRCGRMRFAIETDVLAKSRKFKALLDKVEADKARGPLGDEKITIFVSTALRHGIQNDPEFDRPMSAHRGALGLRERLGTMMNAMTDQEGRERLKDKLRSACGHRAHPSRASLDHEPSGSSPALSSVGEAIMQQAGSVGAMLGQRAGQVRDHMLR